MRLPLSNQTFKFIPKKGIETNVDIRIVNKAKRKEVYFLEDIETTKESYFYKVVFDVELMESENYIIEILIDSEIVYRGLIFATDKNIPFSINEGKFKEHPTNNEYIILDNE